MADEASMMTGETRIVARATQHGRGRSKQVQRGQLIPVFGLGIVVQAVRTVSLPPAVVRLNPSRPAGPHGTVSHLLLRHQRRAQAGAGCGSGWRSLKSINS